MSLNACGFFVFIPSFNKGSTGQANPFFLFHLTIPKLSYNTNIQPQLFQPSELVRKHHISKNQKFREERRRLKIRTLHIIIYYMPPTLYLPMCSTKDGGHIHFSPLLSLRKKKNIYINSPCTNVNIYIEIINNIIHF